MKKIFTSVFVKTFNKKSTYKFVPCKCLHTNKDDVTSPGQISKILTYHKRICKKLVSPYNKFFF
jgi:hypothetical protein